MTPERLIAVARGYLGVSEQPRGSNSGPHITDWLKLVSCHPGDPWCAAAACGWIYEANGNAWPAGFTPSGGSLALWRLNPKMQLPRGTMPAPGDIAIWAHGHGRGHTAIVQSTVEQYGLPTAFLDIGGNTNADGSRDGYEVAENVRPFDSALLVGFLRVCV